ncbi:SRPBCC family protein [Notoacmeibacter sp. MSK16QG-6]|uniref:SRPBCC family protein n=1 Tax=Notoacmeibacter sp. MSK16QG-6 TaxID=2957982 RepID=UPI00209E204B|nr:SRPBCC family protein [Notoacmeibacter sp. MSK16QG-6]MCP1198834.1 SRPBCC family protein [Notoacmeibacter sp. MSK16QG-6]
MTDQTLFIERTLDAPRQKLWRCWTEPDLLKQWFCPKPWSVAEAQLDIRPGGVFQVVMQSPEGERHDNPGQVLDVVPQERLVTTDAFIGDWQPGGKPFLVSTVTFADAGEGRTAYRWEARHWSEDDRRQHEEMGFEQGWNAATDQLEALAKTI